MASKKERKKDFILHSDENRTDVDVKNNLTIKSSLEQNMVITNFADILRDPDFSKIFD